MKLTKKTSIVQKLLDNPIVWKSELKQVPIPTAANYLKLNPFKPVQFKIIRVQKNNQYESKIAEDQPTDRVRRLPERKRKQTLIPNKSLDDEDEEIGFHWDPSVNCEKYSSPDPTNVNYEKKSRSDPDFNKTNEIGSDSYFQHEDQYNTEDSDSGNEVKTKEQKENPAVVVLERLPASTPRGGKVKKNIRRGTSNTKELIPCPHCHRQLKSEEKLRKHIVRHKTSLVPCPKCGKQVKDGVFLKFHLRISHSRKKGDVRQFPCPIPDCETAYVGLNRVSLVSHISRLHPTYRNQFRCSTCSKTFVDQAALDRHNQVRHCSSHMCTLCGKVFPST